MAPRSLPVYRVPDQNNGLDNGLDPRSRKTWATKEVPQRSGSCNNRNGSWSSPSADSVENAAPEQCGTEPSPDARGVHGVALQADLPPHYFRCLSPVRRAALRNLVHPYQVAESSPDYRSTAEER